jgi:tRNA threonylcarbamoyladenosine biosynthesis protein TsaE
MATPQPRRETWSFELLDEAATATLARDLAGIARAGDVIALVGELGSGKTAFARAFINALPRPGGAQGSGLAPAGEATGEASAERATTGTEEVPSPTFTLLQIYERAPAPVWHVDLYRLERPADALELGFEEAIGHAITLIEWPDRLGALLPAERLELCLEFGAQPTARRATLTGTGAWPARLQALGRHG